MQQNRRTELRVLRKDYKPTVTFTLKGKVTDNQTKEPIAGTTVKLVGSDNSSLVTETDSLGNYFFDWTKINPNTSYIVSAEKFTINNKTINGCYWENPK